MEKLRKIERRPRDASRSPLGRAIQYLEFAGGGLLCLLAIATPWMFGTTQEWSVRLMNQGCALLGVIFSAVWLLNRFQAREAAPASRFSSVTGFLFVLANLAVLGFCLVAWFNYRATFSISTRIFTYNPAYNPSLPITYDRDLTLQTFFNFAACFALFWSTRYWLLRGWNKVQRRTQSEATASAHPRLQLILWVLSLNGLALAVQGILQRLSGSSKLLWFKDSWSGQALSCFGPFSYRGNAAEYLNLLWPVAVGFWWICTRRRLRSQPSRGGIADGPELLLLPAFILMPVAVFMSLSRGGAAIAAATGAVLLLVFLSQSSVTWKARLAALTFTLVILVSVWFLDWENLSFRLANMDRSMSGRTEIYENSQQIASDYPTFGTGPGSFRSVYHLYRSDTKQPWHGFLHDDWLETRITFGRAGVALLWLNLGLLFLWMLAPGRAPVSYFFTVCGAASLIGALVHAKFDFPFQTYSIFFTFVLLAAVITCTSPTKAT